MSIAAQPIKQYHVFLASPGDLAQERQLVRQFFDRYNRHTAHLWGVRFEVVDWENYSTIGVGRPQELITQQTLERFRDSLVLIIGLMAQQFGSPTGMADSGTEEEFRWALEAHRTRGVPEIKWFFRRIDRFVAPPDPDAISEALAQWKKVHAFRQELKASEIFFTEYQDVTGFQEVLESDLSRWLADRTRPWLSDTAGDLLRGMPEVSAPRAYYEHIEREFHRLDISGIDNDRAFEIPLSDIYVRLRVMSEEDAPPDAESIRGVGTIDIQAALVRYPKLVIVGDPGSGKSTFLKFVALMLARAALTHNPGIALAKLSLVEPFPVPIFIPCWDLSDSLKKRDAVTVATLMDFVIARLASYDFSLSREFLETLLRAGNCCLLFDGLDEVPADSGRAIVSRLLEECVRRFPENRYVVTSRIRAYTGDTILQGQFARCDIQPFDENDRTRFLSSWIGLLFKIPPDRVAVAGSDAGREFQSLTRAIESSDRIRPLAVNPLLLTVIAIVHWNRKRLPEQRVELYGECVDVLLGQRKEAERIQLGRQPASLSEERESEDREKRAWVRKRFGEIALHILSLDGSHEEATKADVIKLLAGRFIDQGAATQEQAESRALYFLERQELRSGLLVSRREQSYRFVHLTFQEYLAAWHLSNQEFGEIQALVQARLRQQRWFETLQLLGSEWARQSDEKLDRYVAWLLAKQGVSIAQRAPIVALCANIVRDTTGVAELRPETRKRFVAGVEGTLDAFRPGSGIPALTQLEILDALGQLGAAVKGHLVNATRSGLFQVRRRAIEMLLPHLADDELFEMGHILTDRSKEPIKTFLLAVLRRDPGRAVAWLLGHAEFSEKATEAFMEMYGLFRATAGLEGAKRVARGVFERGRSRYSWAGEYAARGILLNEIDDVSLSLVAVEDQEPGVRARALGHLASRQSEQEGTWGLVRDAARNDSSPSVRSQAITLLGRANRDWEIVVHAAEADAAVVVRRRAIAGLATRAQNDVEALRVLVKAVAEDSDSGNRVTAMRVLAEKRRAAPETWRTISAAGRVDAESIVRYEAMRLLVIFGALDETAKATIREGLAKHDSVFERRMIFHLLAQGAFPGALERRLLSEDLDALNPAIDPRQVVGALRVTRAAHGLGIPEADVRVAYARCAAVLLREFGIKLGLHWEAGDAQP
jgi:DNA replicative helicase MCM subunit Mcm2 (Cdc46/Mcm family)